MSHFDLFDSYHLRRPRTFARGFFVSEPDEVVTDADTHVRKGLDLSS